MTVQQEKSGTWFYSFMVKGYREHESIPNCTCKENAEKHCELRKNAVKAMFNGIIPMDEKVQAWVDRKIPQKEIYTVKFMCQKLTKDYEKKKNKSINKLSIYTDYFLSYFGEDRDITTIKKKDIEEMLESVSNHINKQGLKVTPATRNRYFSHIRRAFNVLIEDEDIDFQINPCKGIHKLNEVRRKNKDIIPRNLKNKFLENLPQPQRDMVELDLNLGFRMGNIFKLNKSQINLESGYIILQPEDNKGKKLVKKKINNRAREIIMKYYDKSEFYLFTHENGKYKGKPYTTIKKSWKSAAKAIGKPNLTPHDARRSVGTWVYKKTKDIDLARRILDHSSNDVTELYIITSDKEVDKALLDLDN